MLGFILPLVLKTPSKREWLPAETEAILSINTQKLQQDELPKRWAKDQPEEWRGIWMGLFAKAQLTPVLNLSRDSLRVTRALTGAAPGVGARVHPHPDQGRCDAGHRRGG